MGTQTKFLAVVTSFELPDQQCAAAFCIMPSLLAKHLQTWTELALRQPTLEESWETPSSMSLRSALFVREEGSSVGTV